MNLFKKILVTLLVSAIALFGFTGVSAQDAAGDEPAKTEDAAPKAEKKGKKGKKKHHKKGHKKHHKKGDKKAKEEGKTEPSTPAPAEEGAGEQQ